MVWISDVQVSRNDGNVFHLTLSEGDVRGRFIGHYGWVVVVANKVEGQAGSGMAHQIIGNDTDYPALLVKKIVIDLYNKCKCIWEG
jgi:hypothetical protein